MLKVENVSDRTFIPFGVEDLMQDVRVAGFSGSIACLDTIDSSCDDSDLGPPPPLTEGAAMADILSLHTYSPTGTLFYNYTAAL